MPYQIKTVKDMETLDIRTTPSFLYCLYYHSLHYFFVISEPKLKSLTFIIILESSAESGVGGKRSR